MRPIPEKLKKQIASDPTMRKCAREDCTCCDEFGNKPPHRAEWDHTFIYAGKQINERWAIIGVCWYHHRGPGFNKEFNQFLCLSRMTGKELKEAKIKYPRTDWEQIKKYLSKKYLC